MQYAWQLGLKVEPAKRIDGRLYRFVLTEKDGTEVGYEYGKLLEEQLRGRIYSSDPSVDANDNQQ